MKRSDMSDADTPRIAAVIPCYRVGRKILDVIEGALSHVDLIIAVDDRCPQHTGDLVRSQYGSHSDRVIVIVHQENLGVGGAVKTGYRAAIENKIDIVVKIDGDGQMDPNLIPKLIQPIYKGAADYVKGNRFYDVEYLTGMPKIRLFGNAALSFVNKISSGYWNIMDPTNGFTAIHRSALQRLTFDKIADRFFFESDMLFNLYLANAVVVDFPMRSRYADEESSLRIGKILLEFPILYLKNMFRRIFYTYIIRDFNAASLEGILGSFLVLFGTVFGTINWIFHAAEGTYTPAGTIMVAALPIILGTQLLLAALSYDISNIPAKPIQAEEESFK